MTEPTRKLAAILAADVVGYSRLIAEDEARTLDALRALRRELFEPLVAEHRGAVVKRMGDGWLVAFGSVVDAAQCAIQVQERLAGHDRIKLRVGVHLGDIVHEDEDIYGDGVNIAARLQEVAEPGGILISGTAYESLVGRLDSKFEDAGEQKLKNVQRPVRAWRWAEATVSALHSSTLAPPGAVEAPLALPSKPSIAVLPFANMSNDPEQEFLADGIAEDVTTALSKFGSLFVISRSSAFSFKGQNVSVARIAEELGVRYVVEGSVRKAGNRVRITAQLIDAVADAHVWAERFDGELDDIFELQDRITQEIVIVVAPDVEQRERDRLIAMPTKDIGAWELVQRGIWHQDRWENADLLESRELFAAAIERDPRFALPYALLSFTTFYAIRLGLIDDEQAAMQTALEQAKTAISLDPKEPYGLMARSRAHQFFGQNDLALHDVQSAIALNPNFCRAYGSVAWVYYHSFGDAEKAIENFSICLRLGPRDPWRWASLIMTGAALRQLGRHEEAIDFCRRACQLPGSFLNPMNHAAALAEGGYPEEARQALGQAIAMQPKLSISYMQHYFSSRHPVALESLIASLRKAGLREAVDD